MSKTDRIAELELQLDRAEGEMASMSERWLDAKATHTMTPELETRMRETEQAVRRLNNKISKARRKEAKRHNDLD